MAAELSGTPSSIAVFLGNGDGTLQSSVGYPLSPSPLNLFAADLNGDTKVDLLVVYANGSGEQGSFLQGNGDGTFQAAKGSDAGSGSAAVLKDFNGDGKLDLALGGVGDVLEIDFGNGDGTFAFGAVYSIPAGGPSIAADDFNHDGKLDLAAVNENSNNVSVLLGNGDGTFQNTVNYAVPFPSAMVSSDWNGDGGPDLAVFDGRGASVAVLLNERGDAAALSSSKNPSISGQSVTFTANVTVTVKGSVQRNGALTGTVTFKEGSTVLGTGTVTQGKATFATSSLASGTHNITASYSGNTNYNPATSPMLVQTVNP